MNIFVNKLSFIVVFLAACVFLLWLSFKGFIFLLPFLFAYAIAKPLNRLCKWINKFLPLPFPLITFFVVLIFIGLFFGSISFLIYKSVQSSGMLTEQIKSASTAINHFAQNSKVIEVSLPWNETPILLSDVVVQFYDVIFKAVQEMSNKLINTVISIIKTVPSISLFIFFMFLSLYFITKDRDKLSHLVHSKIESIESKVFHKVKKHTFDSIKSYIKAIFILVFITFVISFIGMTILKVPYAPLLALLVAIVDFMPLVGPAAVYVPWIVFLILVNNYKLAFALFIVYLCTTLTRQILEPKIISHKIGAPPLLTIVSMYICYRIIGVFGLILGPIVVMLGLIIRNGYRLAVQKSEH